MSQDFEPQIPIIPVVVAFALFLLLSRLLRKKLRARYLRQEGQVETEGGRIPSIEERVAANSAWARGEIRSKGGMFAACMWLVALVWNLTFGVSFFKMLSNPEIKTGGLVVLGIFALLGLPIIGFAVYLTKRHYRFGESLCRITGKAGVLGRGIRGNIITKTEIEPEGDYTFMLQCVETYSVGSGNNRTSKSEVHWQGTQIVPRSGASSRAGIPFSIEIPSYPPETGYALSRGQLNWQLSIKAPTKGVDYVALFIVPVFKDGRQGA